MTKFTVAIAGGGIAGLCLAAALSKQENIKVDVYEASRKFDEVGVGLTLWGRIWEAMRLMGLAEDCIQASMLNASSSGLPTDPVGFRLRDFKHPEHDYGVLPMRDGHSLHRGDLLHILLRRVPPSCTHLKKRLRSYVENPRNGHVTLYFADGTSATCDVLIGCDGIRDQRYARHIHPRWSGIVAYRFLTPTAALAARNPRHSLLSGAQIYLGKGMHIVGYPISKTMLNFAVSKTDLSKEDTPWPSDSWSAVLDRKANAERIKPLFKDWHPEARDIIETIDSSIEWAMHDLEPLPFYVRGRVALVGDAAHAAMPYVGAGASYALEDAYVLARILTADVTTRETLPLALQAYQHIRLPYGNKLVVDARRAARAYQYLGPEGDDMRRVQRTVFQITEDVGRVSESGPEKDAHKAIAWLQRRLSASGSSKTS